jgi:hypothetical protein
MKRTIRLVALGVTVLLASVVLFAAAQTDDFNRANESPLASPWIAPDGVSTSKFDLLINHVVGNGGATIQLMYYNFAFAGDHYSQATLGGSDLTAVATYAGVAVRIQASGQSAYVYGIIAGAGSYKIQKINSGTFTALQTCSGTPTVGDVLKLSVSGTSLTGTVNGGSTCSATDSDHSGGKAGLFGYNGSSAFTLDDWSGDDVGGGGSTCTGGMLLLGAGKC